MIKKTVMKDYDKENDIYYASWGKCIHSMEILDGKLVLDFDKKADIVGIEIFDFSDIMVEAIKYHDKIFKRMDKMRKKK